MYFHNKPVIVLYCIVLYCIVNVNIDGHAIKSTPDLKLLGVTLDDKLKYNIHISDICKLASKKVSVLVRLRKMITSQDKHQLYKSAILPNLTYCHTVWYFCKASDARKLERVQERALRAVYDNRTLAPGSFAAQFRDHLRSRIMCGPRIICGPKQHTSRLN